jgi:opacity protein-like surface antigen
MKALRIIAATFVAACLMTAAAAAANIAGNWKWTSQGRNGAQDYTAKFALADGKLTGSVVAPGFGGGEPMTIDISDATFTDGTVTFSVVRDFNGNKFATKYTGKLDGDAIKCSIERPGRGEGAAPTKTDWSATRVTDKKM